MSDLREHLLDLRKAIPDQERTAANAAIATQLYQLPEFKHSKNIGCYQAYAGEVGTDAIIKAIIDAKKTCFLPKVERDLHLTFAEFNNTSQLEKNDHGILEPVAPHHICEPEQLDLVIVPLIAFDAHRHRMGWGKGCYDRTFEFLNVKPRAAKPFLVGLGYQLQCVVELTANLHDVRLNAVISEEKIYS